MNASVIYRLQQKFPHLTLTVLDIRSATIRESVLNEGIKDIEGITSTSKDLSLSSFSETVVRAQKPRSRDTVALSKFDEELEMFLRVGKETVYYMPTGYDRYCHYKTNVFATGSVLEDVAQMVQIGLDQSAQIHGEIRLGETRMFCLQNEQIVNPYPVIHITVERESRSFRIAAEVASDTGRGYHTMLSFQVPSEDMQESLFIKAGNVAYYLN
ncbi:MAG: hypothetical protein EOP06_05080 [Proteobacteria bacterium]|nr:MAG: hypothetical protein EOP06_05080 [Pseudomonadota bacterium]